MSHIRFAAVLVGTLAVAPHLAEAGTKYPDPPDPGVCEVLRSAFQKTEYRDWLVALDPCWNSPGETTWPEIFYCGMKNLPGAHQYGCVETFLWQANITQETVAAIVDFKSDAGCPALILEYQGKKFASWMTALNSCQLPTNANTRDAIINCAFGRLPREDRRPCLRKHLEEKEPITPQLVGEIRAANPPTDTVSANQAWFDPSGIGPEQCELPHDDTVSGDYYTPTAPESVFDHSGAGLKIDRPAGRNLGDNEGRLRFDLRQVARTADPRGCALPMAARTFALAAAVKDPAEHDELIITARAYADLAVTGRRAFEKFRADPPGAAFCIDIASQLPDQMTPGCAPPSWEYLPPSKIVAGCGEALDRAYDVANYLRTGQAVTGAGTWFDEDGKRTAVAAPDHARKVLARDALGWIAVSGEDDLPHRPVNVPSSDSPQFDLTVQVEAPFQLLGLELPFLPQDVFVDARYVIAQSQGNDLVRKDPGHWALAADFKPSIPEGSEVLFFIHGMDSRAEEAEDITRFLFARMARIESQKNLVIVTVDLPSSGYTEVLSWSAVSPMNAIGFPRGVNDFQATGRTPVLDFLETFFVNFATTLDQELTINGRLLADVKAVMGGSLGGNLSFRLGRRPNTPWITNVIAWSPASVWMPMAAGANAPAHVGPRDTWFQASDRDENDPDDLSPERLGRRAFFFVDTWDQPISWAVSWRSQPQTWYSKSYPCWQAAINNARLDRHETYTAQFLTWHWRLASEQLLYSHHSIDLPSGKPNYLLNDKRMLLACGAVDDIAYNEICDATQITAGQMTLTPGRALYMKHTGHALDVERPRYWATQVQTFLGL